MTTIAGRYSFTTLSKFNPIANTDDLDPNDELKDLDMKSMPKFIPPLTDHMCKLAKKDIKRRGHILGSITNIKRFVWKLSDSQTNTMFEFFSSAKNIQNVAFGTIKGGLISESISN